MADLQNMDREIFKIVQKADDLEAHVSLLTFDGHTYLEIREFVPSLNEYGRGFTIQIDKAEALRVGVNEVVRMALERKLI